VRLMTPRRMSSERTCYYPNKTEERKQRTSADDGAAVRDGRCLWRCGVGPIQPTRLEWTWL
jgi:hypothetical protein